MSDERGAEGAAASRLRPGRAASPTRASTACGRASASPEPHPQPPHYRVPDDRRVPPRRRGLRRRQPAVVRPGLRRRRPGWGGPIAPPRAGRRRHAHRRGRGHRGRAASTRDLMKGDPLRGVHAFYSASAREWWAPLRPGHRVCPAQRPRRRARQAERVRRAGRPRVDRPGVPRRRRPAAVGPVPADDPHRAHEGARDARSTTTSSSRPTPTSEIAAIDGAVRAPSGRGAPSPAGGRTSTRATRSARW